MVRDPWFPGGIKWEPSQGPATQNESEKEHEKEKESLTGSRNQNDKTVFSYEENDV